MRDRTVYLTSIVALSLSGCAGIGHDSGVIQVNPSPSTTIASSQSPKNEIAKAIPTIETVAFRFDADGQYTPDEADLLGLGNTPLSPSDRDGNDPLGLYPVTVPQFQVSDADYVIAQNQDIVTDAIVAGQTYTLAEIEEMALNNNPAIAAANATLSKAAGLRNQVGARPNPTLGYFGQQLADRNTDQHGVYLEQEFVRGNKLELNRAVLSHTSSAQRWEIETQRNRVLTDVRVRFYEAIAAQQQLDATRNFETVARRGVDVALDRQKAEEGTLIEVLQSKTLLSEITLAAERSEAAYIGAWKDLAAIAGMAESTPARLVAELDTPDSSPDWSVAYSDIVSQSPELSTANALVCEKAALLKRQQVQMVPNITGQLGAGYDNGTDSGMINVQVSAPIPVWNKNSGNISAAYADYTRAIENVNRIEQSIKSRLARVAQDFDMSIAAVKKYEDEIIPQASESLDLSEQAYQAGELDFLQVLIVRRSYYESMIRFIEAKGQLAQASAKVDGLVLTGGLDDPQDFTDGDGIRGASFGGQ